MNRIPVIDLFAGPGGLGEGFSALEIAGAPPFRIALSIEKDEIAHRTLVLRAFLRQFRDRRVPEDYYRHLRGEISRETLFERHPEEAAAAVEEAWCAELGREPHDEVRGRIRRALKKSPDWVLIGGPPCQAYSLVGRARRGGIKDDDKRAYLYLQYLKVIADHGPLIFVMENVKGILSAQVAGERIFQRIRDDLAHPARALGGTGGARYRILSFVRPPDAQGNLRPGDYVIRAEEYGIPQARHRVILLGVREDLPCGDPPLLRKCDPPSVRDVIGDLPRLRSALSKEPDSGTLWVERIGTELDRLLRRVSGPELDAGTRKRMIHSANRLVAAERVQQEFLPGDFVPSAEPDWYSTPRLGGVCNHAARGHMASDLLRYLFCAAFAEEHGRSPNLRDFPSALLPSHKNAVSGGGGGDFADRFRVQVADRPATTVTSHIAKDGHYYIHYDPLQCRSLTVREAARIQTFPDDYLFSGSRTAQYHQVGNAVPPLLARKLAEIVHTILSNRQAC